MRYTSLGSRRSFGVVMLLLTCFLIALAGLGAALYIAVEGSDNVAIARQSALVDGAIDSRLARLPHDQESVAVWDDAIEKRLDTVWLHENFGEWSYDYFHHDRGYILDADRNLVYAMADGAAIDDTGIGTDTRGLLHDIVRALRAKGAGVEPSDKNWPAWLGDSEDRSSLMHTENLHVTDIALFEGRPAIVSAMPIVPHSDRVSVTPGREDVFISVQFVDGHLAREAMDRLLLKDVRVETDRWLLAGEQLKVLANKRGDPVAYLKWRPHLPANDMVAALLPAIVALVALMALLFAALALRLYRASTSLEASEAQARHLAFFDTLTGLPNRTQLTEQLERAIVESAGGTRMALIIVDLDHFKGVNDSLGHPAGDDLIREFASRMLSLLAPKDSIARIGGDEFAVILGGDRSPAQVDAFCEQILLRVREPFNVMESKAYIGASIGVLRLPTEGNQHELMRRADVALYASKRAGRNCFRVFNKEMDATVQRKRRFERELREALEKGDQLLVYYQPEVAAETGRIVGYEALLRWKHPRRGLLVPSVFLPIAEEAGFVTEIDLWVLSEGCKAARAWPDLFLSVNVSSIAFRAPGLATRFLRIVEAGAMAPTRVQIEVTESVLLEENEIARVELKALREAGVRIVLDDFGTGYSSLSHLQRLSVDKIKVDRSFVKVMDQEFEARKIVDAIVHLGHALGLTVTAEGVETVAQLEYLKSIGCDEVQGYFFAEPLPPARLRANTDTAARAAAKAPAAARLAEEPSGY